MVTSRIKECNSALDALRRQQQGATFDRDQPKLYTLTSLKDLAGVRVLVFPRSRLAEIHRVLHKRFLAWEIKLWSNAQQGWTIPAQLANDEPLAFKYNGHCQASARVGGEIQIVSMLIGLFWEVEHAAIYKPTPRLKGVAADLGMKQRTADVYTALRAFEDEFEALVRPDAHGK